MAKPLSLQPYTLRKILGESDPYPILEKVAKIGYHAVEGKVGKDSPTEFRRRLTDMGLKVSSYFGGFPTFDTVNEFIDTALALGVEHTVSGFWIPDVESVDAIKRSAEKVNTVLPAIQEAGLTFSLHNHWMEFWTVEGRLVLEQLLELAPGVGAELDIYWASNFGEHKSEEMVSKFKDHIHLMHVKDGPLVEGQPMLPAGSGKVDVPACIHAADPNVLDWLIVEFDEYDGDILEGIAASRTYLVEQGLALA